MPENLLIQAWSFLDSGGGVMPPLLAISVWMWWLILLKVLDFTSWRRQEMPVRDMLRTDRTVFGAPWQNNILILARQMGRDVRGMDENEFIERLVRPEARKIDRHIETILVLSKAAPLLGLLGTVCGMISTFEVISLFGTGEAKPMAAGISEALITTQTGLLVAVPGLVLGSLLQKRAEVIKARMQRFCLSLVRHLDLSQTSAE
ncbi:MotA/TolQ/ExbB proton channel family protein [Desulfovermiculus halophilus]|jgi:biopolymer transport protein ExbB|uniref:MotA/TolQ/ExbB proton channel family protein n=1 Tax=Desulfovermiculus halophilus TaxID=339722 RepID=UPI000482BAE2|nr:MotA/TolQ/ExbB proton channel family protein [Desulfovermiculus halophilus]